MRADARRRRSRDARALVLVVPILAALACSHTAPPPMVPDPPEPIVASLGADAAAPDASPVVTPSPTAEPEKPPGQWQPPIH